MTAIFRQRIRRVHRSHKGQPGVMLPRDILFLSIFSSEAKNKVQYICEDRGHAKVNQGSIRLFSSLMIDQCALLKTVCFFLLTMVK